VRRAATSPLGGSGTEPKEPRYLVDPPVSSLDAPGEDGDYVQGIGHCFRPDISEKQPSPDRSATGRALRADRWRPYPSVCSAFTAN
jgi:hypothetical protein